MYYVYGDESHDEGSRRVFAVAGLLGRQEDWASLETAWLDRMGGRTFHASDCETDHGEFAGTSHSENLDLYADLVKLLAHSSLYGFGSAIDLAGHDEFFPGVPEDIPYYRCFRDVLVFFGEHAARMKIQEKIHFVFDGRQESNYNTSVLYSYMARLPEWKSSPLLKEEISFSTRSTVGIQAADLWARETMKHLDNMIGPVKRPMRRSMELLASTNRFGGDYFMKEFFSDFRRQFEEVSRTVGVSEQAYANWLKENRAADSISSRHRYLIDLDKQP